MRKRGSNNRSMLTFTRLEEKDALTDCNFRFAEYIERVQAWETERGVLMNESHVQKQKFQKEKDALRTMYESEIDGLHSQVDRLTNERAALSRENTGMRAKIGDLEKKCAAVSRTNEDTRHLYLEASKRADDNDRQRRLLHKQLQELKVDSEKLGALCRDLETQLEKALLDATAARQEAKSKNEQLRLIENSRKKEREQWGEVAWNLRSKQLTEHLERESEKRITSELDMLRREHAEAMATLKDELRKVHEAKERGLRQSLNDSSNEAKNLRVELSNSQKRVATLESDLSRSIAEAKGLRSRVSGLENSLEKVRNLGQAEKKELRGDIEQLQDDLDKERQRNHDYLTEKASIDAELATYAHLLETEENRIAASDAKRGKRACTLSKSEQQTTTKSSKRVKLSESSSPRDNVRFGFVAKDGEYVSLVNFGQKVVDLADWSVSRGPDDCVSSSHTTFTFPRGVRLAPFGCLRVYSTDAVKTPGSLERRFSLAQATWPSANSSVSLTTRLRDSDGCLMATHHDSVRTSPDSFVEDGSSSLQKGCSIM